MKDTIKKLLREELGTHVSDDAIRRLRIVFSQMKTMKGVDMYIVGINKEKKQPYGFEHMREASSRDIKVGG